MRSAQPVISNPLAGLVEDVAARTQQQCMPPGNVPPGGTVHRNPHITLAGSYQSKPVSDTGDAPIASGRQQRRIYIGDIFSPMKP